MCGFIVLVFIMLNVLFFASRDTWREGLYRIVKFICKSKLGNILIHPHEKQRYKCELASCWLFILLNENECLLCLFIMWRVACVGYVLFLEMYEWLQIMFYVLMKSNQPQQWSIRNIASIGPTLLFFIDFVPWNVVQQYLSQSFQLTY